MLFKSLKVMKEKGRQSNGHRLEKIKKVCWLIAMWYPRLDPGMDKRTLVENW